MKTSNLMISREAKKKEEIKSCREDTKRGAYVKQLFSKEGVTSKTSVLGTTAKGSGKLWAGITDILGYGFKAESVGGKLNEKTGIVEGGEITHYGILPVGMEAPFFAVKEEKAPKAPKAPKEPKAAVAKLPPKAPVAKPKADAAA